MKYYIYLLLYCLALSCSNQKKVVISPKIIHPVIITEPVNFDSDDPAIWINSNDPSKSLIIGTDKDINGGLFVFDLKGKIRKDLTVHGLKRPNNVDVAYHLILNGKKTDIAVTTERFTHKIRIFSLPEMKPIDNGGISVFEGQTGKNERDVMGISLYTDPKGKIYAIVGRKTGPQDGSYLWQYLLHDSGKGYVEGKLVRKFGHYSGRKEIESIAVDNENGYIYYSDEQFGVRKYYADPSKGNQELDVFAKTGFTEDHEGISIYKTDSKKGYILVSDQGSNKFHIFRREGKNILLKIVQVYSNKSDGSDIVSIPLNNTFKHGIFVVMSNDKTFHYYRWEDIAGKDLKISK